MAIAVLEKNVDTLEKIEEKQIKKASLSADEQHNARIGEIYQRLIKPNAKVEEVLGRKEEVAVEAPKDIFAKKVVLVENARADADIFRADSPVNRKVTDSAPVQTVMQEEEENEDLRPTSTTIQYKTAGVSRTVEEGKIENTGAEKRRLFSKKEKIIIAVVVSIVIAMFVLIVVNSAILSGINNEMSSLQSSLESVKASYAEVNGEFDSMLADSLKNAEEYAISIGLVR